MNSVFLPEFNNKALGKTQKYNDGYNIMYAYNPYWEQFQHYCGVLNLIDRDHWNNKLNDRQFLINYPPWYNIVYPQNTSPCVIPDCYKVLENPNLNQRSADYWGAFDANFNPEIGVPTNPEQKLYLKFQRQEAQCEPSETPKGCEDSKHACPPELPIIKTDLKHVNEALLAEKYPSKPWINGVNRNIEAESKLFGLGYYNNTDWIPYYLKNHPKFTDPEVPKKLFDTYFKDTKHIYPNVTPRLFHNTTKIKNNYPVCLDYEKYNRYLKEMSECCRENYHDFTK